MSTTACSSSSSNDIQLFVRTMDGKSLVLDTNTSDTIGSIYDKIHLATGLPLCRQRLVYGSKKLELLQTLFHYNITNNATLHLVVRMQTSGVLTGIHGLFYAIQEAQRLKSALATNRIQELVGNPLFSSFYPDVQDLFRLREELVNLYISPYNGNKDCAQNLIQGFINSVKDECITPSMLFLKNRDFAPTVLHFCQLLQAAVSHDDPLYIFSRTSLGSMLNSTNIIAVQHIIPFADELATKLSHGLVSSMDSTGRFFN